MNQYKVQVNGKEHDVTVTKRSGSRINFTVGEHTYDVEVSPGAAMQNMQPIAAPAAQPVSAPTPRTAAPNEIRSPMPGLIVDIKVKEGDKVQPGQTVCVMEAMKMENNITAGKSATVKKIHVKPKQEVENNALLIELKE